MTAPVPTALEQATIDRLGIFDEEKFEEIIAHRDDVGCTLKYVSGRPCGNPVTHRARCRSCGTHLGLICALHAQQVEAEATPYRHPACGAELPLQDLVQVVPL